MKEKSVEMRMELPTKSLSRLNFSAITKVVTATGIEESKVKTFKSPILNKYSELKIITTGKIIIFKNEVKRTKSKFFLRNLPKRNPPKVNKAIGEAVAPNIPTDFLMPVIKGKSSFKKLTIIPIKTESIKGFLKNSYNSLKILCSRLCQYLITNIEIRSGITK